MNPIFLLSFFLFLSIDNLLSTNQPINQPTKPPDNTKKNFSILLSFQKK